MEATTHARVLFYRDDRGDLQEVTVTAPDPAELDRVARLYAALERRSDDAQRRWSGRHATFTDAGVDAGQVAEAAGAGKARKGYPWEGPRFSFALLLGETPVWSGPGSLRLKVRRGGKKAQVCRFCGHYGKGLPLVAYCLGCDRSGRDLVIPRGVARATRKYVKSKLKGGVS